MVTQRTTLNKKVKELQQELYTTKKKLFLI
jgi:hypothetical protein